jgi:hypothetical protein
LVIINISPSEGAIENEQEFVYFHLPRGTYNTSFFSITIPLVRAEWFSKNGGWDCEVQADPREETT